MITNTSVGTKVLLRVERCCTLEWVSATIVRETPSCVEVMADNNEALLGLYRKSDGWQTRKESFETQKIIKDFDQSVLDKQREAEERREKVYKSKANIDKVISAYHNRWFSEDELISLSQLIKPYIDKADDIIRKRDEFYNR